MGIGRISVLCPSRLTVAGSWPGREFYLERAVRSIKWQSVRNDFDWEIMVGVDPGRGAEVPDRLAGVRVVESDTPGQAAAVNAAARAATGDIVAILEDDDAWHWRKIELQLSALRDPKQARFTSTSQMEVDPPVDTVRINDFATPSGWLMYRETWEAVGPLNESFRWHVDNEWLGRLNVLGIPRVHLIEQSTGDRYMFPDLVKRSDVRVTGERLPLVLREAHYGAATTRINRNLALKLQSLEEYRRLIASFGEIPW